VRHFTFCEAPTTPPGVIEVRTRCIDCHSLPPVAKYSAEQWPGLVSKMAGRAHLKPAQRDTIVVYLLAARAQPELTPKVL
jgi:hypothetical protein